MAQMVLITRSEADAAADMQTLAAGNIPALAAPMLAIRPLDTKLSLTGFDAIAFTSRHAPAIAMTIAATAEKAKVQTLPCFCVGEATAQAARRAGFAHVVTADDNKESAGGDGMALAAAIARSPHKKILWPAGVHTATDMAAALAPHGITAEKIPVYEAIKTGSLNPPALAALVAGRIGAVCVYSGRAGENLDRLLAAHAIPRDGITLIATSMRVAGLCGQGWHKIRIAVRPGGAAMREAAIAVMGGTE